MVGGVSFNANTGVVRSVAAGSVGKTAGVVTGCKLQSTSAGTEYKKGLDIANATRMAGSNGHLNVHCDNWHDFFYDPEIVYAPKKCMVFTLPRRYAAPSEPKTRPIAIHANSNNLKIR